jgi:anti-sigma-K factor RskA
VSVTTTPAPPPVENFNLPTDAAGRETLAAEFALGTLDADTSARVAAAVDGDSAWRTAVEAWETRLAPLAALAYPEPPPPDIWDRIEARITPHRAYVPRGPRTPWVWKAWAIIATLAAAGIAAVAFLPALRMTAPVSVRLVGPVIPAASSRLPVWIVDVDAEGQLRIQPFRGAVGGAVANSPTGRDLQLWGLLPGATAPVDLGVLPKKPGVVTVPVSVLQPVPDMMVEISLEPEGGSKTGRPTGQVLFVGRLVGVATPN